MRDNIEEYKNWFDTEEGKKHLKEFMDKLEKDDIIKKQLVSTDHYIKWLEKFTKENPVFDDDSWLYHPEQISKEDNEKVALLSYFYGAIDEYAEANYINPTQCGCSKYYSIEYNSKIYEIGLVVGQGATNFCNTLLSNREATIIPFEQISNPSITTIARTEKIKKDICKIGELFNTLVNDGIPVKAIKEETDKVLQSLMGN